MSDCQRCGGSFRTELCVVHRDNDRGRIEAWLCYNCRDETTNERLGYTGTESEPADSVEDN